MNARITFVSPTFRKDVHRFALLRESMERCEIDIPHVAVVHHEDLPLFEEIPYRHKLSLLSSRDVLPARVEARRTAKPPRSHSLGRWFDPWRQSISGWIAQQVIKLSAPRYTQTDGIVCLDSDVFFVDRVEEHDFYAPDGLLHLYESDRHFTVQTVHWMAQSMLALKVSLEHEPLLYIHHPLPMHRAVVLGLQNRLEEIHGSHWIDVFLDLVLTEYTSYGVYARFVNGLKDVAPVKPPFTISFWNQEQLEGYAESLLPRIRTDGAKVVCINSGVGRKVDEYRSIAEKAWKAARR